MWTDKYIGIQFVEDGRGHAGCDCWGLIVLIYKEQLGIELYDYKNALSLFNNKKETAESIKNKIECEEKKWVSVNNPIIFDVILMRGNPFHIGIICGNNKMLHVDSGLSACVENYTSAMHKNKIIGFKRYVV